MRFTTLFLLAAAAVAPACVGEVGGDRKPGHDTTPTQGDPSCAKVEKDVTIRSAADMAALPRTGCYDLYGKLTLQGQAITSLAGLAEINSVDELDLDHTALTAIDTKRSLGIYGRLTVTGNAKLANLQKLSFEIPSTGILIDGNPLLTSLDPLGLDEPKLEEIDGDVAITGNAALTRIPLGNLAKLTGGLTVSSNAQLAAIELGRLAQVGHVEISSNAALTSLGAMAALYRVTGSVTIDANPRLADLAAFTTSLKFIDLGLTITHNTALTDLGALKHLALVGAITITDNQNLVNCRALEVDRCTQHPTTSIISNNKNTSCTSACN